MSAMWEWQDASWHRLNSKDAGALEAAYLQDPLGCCPVALGPNESCYEVDFASMKQRSRGSGRVRNLRRKAPLQEVVLQVHAQASADWQEELHEVLNRAEALAEEAKVCSEIEPPVAEALPSVDFGSLQSLQRSLDLGRVVLLRGAWLVCHTDCLQSVPTSLPAEALWEGPLVAAPAPAPLVLSLGTNVLDAGELQVLAELVSNQASQGIFLDCCSLADPSEGQRDLCEWFASPFTTKCFARSAAVDDASISRCGLRCFQQQLGCLGAGAEVYEVLGLNSESAESVPALQEVAPSVQVTPEAFDIMMKSMDFQRAEDLEIFKELYREAFSSLVGAREWMDCSGLAWEDFQMIQLAEVLVHSKSLVKLVLAENHVGDLGLETLAPCLPETLELLDLSRNYIEDQGLECLAQYLPHRLRQLCLSYNPFGARGMEGLVRSLPKCSQLHSLRLAGISGIASVELDFAPLTALRHLCLNEVQLGQEGLVHLSLPDALEDLQLDNNQLCDLSPLVLRLPPSLRTLALSENELSDQGLVSLNLSLHCFRSLQTLRVNFNHISTQVLGELQQKAPQLQIFAAHPALWAKRRCGPCRRTDAPHDASLRKPMPLRHSVLRGEAKPKPRNVPPLESGARESKVRATTAAVPNLESRVDGPRRRTKTTTVVEDPMERARSEASKHSTDSGRSTKVERPERSKSKEDEDRLSSKESTSSAKRMTNFRKQISRLSSKTAMMSEEPGKQFVPTLRGYLDFLYREAEQKLMWKRLDAATVRLSTIQEGQDARRPVVALTTRNSISQMKTARTAAFEGFEEEERAERGRLEEGASGHLRRHSQSSLDSRVRRQSAVVIDLNFKTPHLEEGEEGDDEGKGDRHTSGSAKEHPLKEPLTAKKVNIAQVREILKHLDDLPKWLEAPLVTSGTGAVPKPLVVAVADNNPDLVGLLIEFRADFTMPYEGESNYKGWIKPGQSLLSSVSNRKGRFIGTMLADRLAQIEEMLTVQTEEEEFVDLDALEVSSSKSAFGAIAATWGTDELKPRHTRGHPKGFYEVLEHLDEGDTSTVWGGIHLETKVPVAIKIEVKSDEIEMWEEIDIMRRLRHPNISRLFETFESETQVFMVLELCHGRLYDSLAEGDSYTVCRSPRLLRQLVLAVACLHEHKISHRDVQLENFLLLKPDGPLEEAIPKLIDFTTAKDFSGGQVLVTKVCTPTYVAKEILSRKMEPYTEKVDVWSLGVVFFIMFCGHPPFVGDTDFEILTKVKKGTWSFQPSPAWTAAPKQGMELIQRMITPVAERFSAQDVLRHEFLAESGRG